MEETACVHAVDSPSIGWAEVRTSHGIQLRLLLCRPLLHALVAPGVAAGFGVEVDAVKCDKAAPFLQRCEAALRKRGVTAKPLPLPAVQCAPVERVRRVYGVLVCCPITLRPRSNNS